MATLTVRIESVEAAREAFISAMRSGVPTTESVLTFPTYQDMHRILTPKRLEIVRALSGRDHLSIREVSRTVGRDFKAVHSDVTALVNAGVIDRQSGGVCFPYDALHVEFDVLAA